MHGRRGAGRLHEQHDLAHQQRQQDHDVQADQQARRRRIVDRRDAPLRRVGMQPDAEHEVEAAPVEQREQDLLRERAVPRPAASPAWLATKRAATHSAISAAQSSSGAMEEGAQRRFAGMALEDADPHPLQHGHARQPFRGQAGHDDADQQPVAAQADRGRQAAAGSRRAPAGWRKPGRSGRSARAASAPARRSLTPKLPTPAPRRRRRISATAGKASSSMRLRIIRRNRRPECRPSPVAAFC